MVRFGRWGIYVPAVYEYGGRADEAQPSSLLFALDLDDLDVGIDALLGQHPTQTFERRLVGRAVFVEKEPHAHQKPFGFA